MHHSTKFIHKKQRTYNYLMYLCIGYTPKTGNKRINNFKIQKNYGSSTRIQVCTYVPVGQG